MTQKTNSKIEIKVGNLAFSGEGDQDWLSIQLQKVIDAADTLGKAAPSQQRPPIHHTAPASGSAPASNSTTDIPLASYLRTKGGEKNQVMRFLATAHWLSGRGEPVLTSTLVAKALADNQQSRLANPADCLNKNVAKGFCEKKKDGGFFITPDGIGELGVEE